MTKKERIQLQKLLYTELIRLTLIVDSEANEQSIFGQMSALVKKARYAVNGESESARIQQLLDLVYTEWQFNCESEKYFHTDNLMMHKVLRHHRGMPVSIGAVVLYLAASLDLPIYPVSFPTQLLLRVEISDESQPAYFINPWNGKKVNKQQMMQWLEGDLGFGSELKMEHLQIASMNTLEDRLETVFKMALTGEGKYEEALKVIQYRLILQPEDPYEIRDRGMILASLGCYQAAFDDINYFIDQCPDDPTALMLKLELPALERQSKACVIH